MCKGGVCLKGRDQLDFHHSQVVTYHSAAVFLQAIFTKPRC